MRAWLNRILHPDMERTWVCFPFASTALADMACAPGTLTAHAHFERYCCRWVWAPREPA